MSRTRTRPLALLATGALSACLTFLAAGPTIIDAAARPARPPLARTSDVAFDAELVRDGPAARVRIRARSEETLAQRCTVEAVVLRRRDAAMARVPVMPTRLWSGSIALRVPARGEAAQELALPAEVAAQLPRVEAEPDERKARIPDQAILLQRPLVTASVELVPRCTSDADAS